jgi:hypothetical protein
VSLLITTPRRPRRFAADSFNPRNCPTLSAEL